MWLLYQNYSCSSRCHRISTAAIMSQTSHRYKVCLKETKQYWKVDLIKWIYGANTSIHNKNRKWYGAWSTVDIVFSFQEWHREWCQHISTGDRVSHQRTAYPSHRSTHCQAWTKFDSHINKVPTGWRPSLLFFILINMVTIVHSTLYMFLHWEYNLLLTVIIRESHEGTETPTEMQKVNLANACYWTVFLYGVVWRITWWMALLQRPSWYILTFNKTITIR